MIEPDLTTALLATHYPLQPAIITTIGQPQAERQLYQVTTITGEQWLVRLCHAAAPSPIWLTVPSIARWLHQQALVLEWCAHRAYPAPRVLRTHTGELVATLTNWHVLVTQFLPGVTRATTLEARQRVAAVLSDLHSRSAALRSIELQRLPWSWWAPLNDAITRAQHLFTVLNPVPAEWADFIVMCQATLHQSHDLQTLPETIIHGDCWMGNAVTSPASPTVLIDWEYAGRGIALLDLGSLLSDCLNVGETASELDDMRIKAVMDGYQCFCTLSTNEADALAAAIRFGIAFRMAIRCHLAQQFGWIGGVQRGLAHERVRFALSERMAQAARQYIKQ